MPRVAEQGSILIYTITSFMVLSQAILLLHVHLCQTNLIFAILPASSAADKFTFALFVPDKICQSLRKIRKDISKCHLLKVLPGMQNGIIQMFADIIKQTLPKIYI